MTWTTFASLTAATGAELDANYTALALQSMIPVTFSGSNTISMTISGATTVPAPAAYQNYLAFIGPAAANNTGATTAAFGSLGAKPVYKDAAAGVTALTGGEIINGNLITLVYDSALNSGGGGFHLSSQAPAIYPVVASSRGLSGSAPGSAKTAAWTATELVASAGIGGVAAKGSTLSLSFNGATTGVNGMDTGSTPTSGQLAVYAIYNPSTGVWGTLGYAPGASVSAASAYPGANAPSGYTLSALLWAGLTDGSGNVQYFRQIGSQIYITPAVVLNATAATGSWISLSLTGAVPYTALTVLGTLAGSGAFPLSLAVASTSGGLLPVYGIAGLPGSGTAINTYVVAVPFGPQPLLTPQSLWYQVGNASQTHIVAINGYTVQC